MPRAEKVVRTEQEMRRRRMTPSDRQEQILRFARSYQKEAMPATRISGLPATLFQCTVPSCPREPLTLSR